jgi:hypothetical protein
MKREEETEWPSAKEMKRLGIKLSGECRELQALSEVEGLNAGYFVRGK